MIGAVAGAALTDRAPDAILFRRPAGDVTAAGFLAAARRAAALLPGDGPVVNLCRDRFAFTVVFAAALLRGSHCVLSGETGAHGLRALATAFPGACSAADDPATESPLPHALIVPDPAAETAPAPAPVIDPGRLAAVVLTSGSTGAPVAHAKHWGALVQRSRAAAVRFGLEAAPPATIVGTVPPRHMYGFETTVLLPLHAAVASWCGPAFYPTDIAQALAAVPGPRVLVTTPLQLRALLGAATDLPPLALTISATSPLHAETAAAAERRWATRVCEIYGATEVGSIASRRTAEEALWTPYPDVSIAFGDDAVVTAPHAIAHALNDEVQPAPDGRFTLLGRRADMVKLAGKRASLAGLNQALLAVEGVRDGLFVPPAAVEREAEGAAARLVAVVVAPEQDDEAILAGLRARIDPAFLPRRIVRLDALPRDDVGKLRHDALAALGLAGTA